VIRSSMPAATTLFNVLDHGALGDGASDDAPAIQAAIDACAAAGGGTVLLPAGRTYLSGSLQLRGHTEFRVERGAILLASSDYADYRPEHHSDQVTGGLFWETELPRRAWITAFEAHDLCITGGGRIDGNGRGFVDADKGEYFVMRGPPGGDQYRERPYTLHLIGCQRLDIHHISIVDGAHWTLRLTGCDDVTVTAIRLHNSFKLPNSDGIDLDRCKRVRVSDCDVRAGDDAICLKSCEATAPYGICEDVVVTNCTLSSASSALKIGNECWGLVRNVAFSNCVVRDSNRGLTVHCGEPGGVENVLFSGIVVETRKYQESWWGRGEPIYVNSTAWNPASGVGTIRHLRFRDILATGENGVFIYAEQTGDVQDVILEGVRIEIGAWHDHFPGSEQDFRPRSGRAGLEQRPTRGVTVEGAANVTLRHVQVVWGRERRDHFGAALYCDRAGGLRLEDFSGEDLQGEPAAGPATQV
jgi:polygalacturonase